MRNAAIEPRRYDTAMVGTAAGRAAVASPDQTPHRRDEARAALWFSRFPLHTIVFHGELA